MTAGNRHSIERVEASRFLARASEIFTSSLDYETTLASVTRLVVPLLADWCVVDLIENEQVRTVAHAASDPATEALAAEVHARYGRQSGGSRQYVEVLRTGRSCFVPELTEGHLQALAADDEHREMVRRLHLTSYMLIPLQARGRMLGIMILATTLSERRYDQADLALAEDLARRAGLAIDNARLHRDVQEQNTRLAQLNTALQEAAMARDRALSEVQAAVAREQAARSSAEAAAEAMRQGAVRLRLALEAGYMGTWEWEIETGRVTWSPTMETIHGLLPGTFGGTFDDFTREIHPGDREIVVKALKQAIWSGADYHVEYRVRWLDGSLHWLEARGSVTTDPQGHPVCLSGICMDVTERKLADTERARLAAIVASSEDAIVGKTLDGIITNWNAAAERLFGYTADEVIGRSISLIIPPDRADEEDAILASLRRGRRIEHYETVRLRKDGRQIDVSVSISPIRDRAGRIVGAAKIARDISARRRAEVERAQLLRREQAARAEAERSAERMASLQSITAALSAVVTPQDVAVAVVERSVAVLGAKAGALLRLVENRAVFEVIHQIGYHSANVEAAEVMRAWQRLRSTSLTPVGDAVRLGQSVILESAAERVARYHHLAGVRAAVGDGATASVPLLLHGRPVGALHLAFATARTFDEDDRALLLTIGRQCAQAIERARLYQETRQTIRERDELFAMVSHDLKNPLAAIKGYAQLLRRRLPPEGTEKAETIAAGLAKIDEMAAKMVVLLNEQFDHARLQTGQPLDLDCRPTDLVALAQNIVAEHQQTTERHRIRVESDVAELIGNWDVARLERVLGNLLSNAIKYSSDGGEIVVKLTRTGDDHEEGGWAAVEVRDQGVGVPADELAHIFERFYRATNVTGRISGSGIGLASARQIVEQHGGTISVASQEGAGTVFTVSLPLQAAANEAYTESDARSD